MHKLAIFSIFLLAILLSITGSSTKIYASEKGADPIIFSMYDPDPENAWYYWGEGDKSETILSGIYIGSSRGEDWLNYDEYIPSDEETFTFYSQTGEVGTVTGYVLVDREYIWGEYFTITEGELSYRERAPLIGLTGDWNPIPRMPVELTGNLDDYEQLIRENLELEYPDYNVREILYAYEIDFNDDGSCETIIVAEIEGDFYEPVADVFVPGMSWATFVISSSKGRPDVRMLDETVSTWEDFGFIEITPVFFDLNGDGMVELVIRELYYEWTGFYVYEMTGDELVEVLYAGFGL